MELTLIDLEMLRKTRIVLIIFILLIITSIKGFSQSIENEFQLRTSVEFSKKIVKNLKIEIAPELRWTNGEALDKYLLSTGLRYKPLDFLSLSAQYRFIGNKRIEESTEYLGRYRFNVKLANKIKRWEPGFRLSYTNYTDDNEDGKYLKYRATLAYDIARSRLTPEAGFEVYHDLDQGNIYKYRTKIEFDYKLSNKLVLTGGYKFDFYKTKEKNRHILDMGLKVKF